MFLSASSKILKASTASFDNLSLIEYPIDFIFN